MPKAQADVESGAAAAAAVPKKAAAVIRSSVAVGPKKVAEEQDPRLRWAFVRKVYVILALQFAVTSGIAAVACLVHPFPRFFTSNSAASWAVFIAILLTPLIVMWPMLKYRQKHPVNLLLLGLFTLCISLSVAVVASTSVGRAVLQAAILTAVAVVGLTLFTFWAANRGYDFTFMFPFLFASLLVLFVYSLIQIFFPLGKVGVTVYGCIATVLFSAFIVFDTNMLVKHHACDEGGRGTADHRDGTGSTPGCTGTRNRTRSCRTRCSSPCRTSPCRTPHLHPSIMQTKHQPTSYRFLWDKDAD